MKVLKEEREYNTFSISGSILKPKQRKAVKMPKPDIFDDIIELLQSEAETQRYTSVAKEHLDDLFGALPGFKPVKGKEQLAAKREPHPQHPSPQMRPAPIHAPAAPPSAPGAAHKDYSAFGWDELAAEVASCRRCGLCEGRTNTVFGAGSHNAELMFIGEGPGADEDAQGLPFVGRAGELLTRMIVAMQFRREDVYIANIVKCRPPNNRQPEEDEAKICIAFLKRQIQLLRPKAIVVLGATPLRDLLGKTGITRMRGKWLEYEGIKVMPTFHPAFLLRNPPAKREVWEDLKQVMRFLGKDPAQPAQRQ